MKRYVPFVAIGSLALLLLLSQTAFASLSFVNANTAHVSSGLTHAVTISATTGNLLILNMGKPVTACDPSTVTDNMANAWTFIASSSAGSFDCDSLWYAKNITGGSVTINSSSTGSEAQSLSVMQISGADTTAPLDAQTTKAVVTGTTIVTGAYSTANANEIVVGGANNNQVPTWTPGTTAGTTMTINPSSTQVQAALSGNITMEYLVVSSTLSSATTSINIGTTTTRGDLVVATFKAAAAAGSSTPAPIPDIIMSASE